MYRIESAHINLFSETDDWENGCMPDTGYSSTYEYPVSGDTLEEFLDNLAQHVLWRDARPDDYEIDPMGDGSGRIDICGMTDEDLNPASERDLAEWRAGRKKLRYVVWSVRAEQVTREPLQVNR